MCLHARADVERCANHMGVVFEAVRASDSEWDSSGVTVPLQVALDACFVPTAQGLRVDEAHLVVIDGLIDSKLQQDLLSLLTDNETAPEPTTERWEQRTVDDAANAHPSWGFKSDVLSGLKHEVAVMEVHARLRKLYPDVDIYHMPANDMQVQNSEALQPISEPEPEATNAPHVADVRHTQNPRKKRQRTSQQHGNGQQNMKASHTGLCQQFVANAAVAGDQFVWHVDADPADVPQDSPWVQQYGLYANRVKKMESPKLVGLLREGKHGEFMCDSRCTDHCVPMNRKIVPGKMRFRELDPTNEGYTTGCESTDDAGRPRLVSIIAYLPSSWGLNEHAETLVLDSATDTGLCVRPRPGRIVVMDQDVMHRVSAPSDAAGRPRYSLVWKLALFNKGALTSPPDRNHTSLQHASMGNTPMCQHCAQNTPPQKLLHTGQEPEHAKAQNESGGTASTGQLSGKMGSPYLNDVDEAVCEYVHRIKNQYITHNGDGDTRMKPLQEYAVHWSQSHQADHHEDNSASKKNRTVQEQTATLHHTDNQQQGDDHDDGVQEPHKVVLNESQAVGVSCSKPPSILLPSLGSVCYFGSARRMRDVQDTILGGS